jgi:hypothetical protein
MLHRPGACLRESLLTLYTHHRILYPVGTQTPPQHHAPVLSGDGVTELIPSDHRLYPSSTQGFVEVHESSASTQSSATNPSKAFWSLTGSPAFMAALMTSGDTHSGPTHGSCHLQWAQVGPGALRLWIRQDWEMLLRVLHSFVLPEAHLRRRLSG